MSNFLFVLTLVLASIDNWDSDRVIGAYSQILPDRCFLYSSIARACMSVLA